MINAHLHSVRDKLLLMVLVANFCTLVAAGAALLYHDIRENREKTVNQLSTLADILAQGSIAALEFDDVDVAQENLEQLRANPNIEAAAIYNAQGQLFARYARDAEAIASIPATPAEISFEFGVEELSVYKRIGVSPNVIGTIYLKEHYELAQWLHDYLVILGLVLVASLGLGFIISSRLQRWISIPIQAVSSVARQVMTQRNYHLRAIKSTEDEIGQLADAFNGMLHTLEHEMAERSAAEQEVRQLNAKLEQRVAERTLELQDANQQLRARTDEAETANRAKADFLANMSHEIRTPMNAILGLAYLLDQSALDADAADLVKKIRNAGRSLQSIINDILDFSKIEAGRLDIEKVPFRLVDVLDNLAGIMSANAGDKDLELVISPPPTINAQLLGDALRLEQVLINLTGNAIKFTDEGSVAVGITLLAKDQHSAKLRFSVTDTGVGIPQDKQAQIFAAFAQADISTTRRFGGTGLGLTICRHLVTQMGGEIGVISEPNKGSEFWFTIPFELCATTTYAAPEMATLDVLIVDDSEIARENLSLTAQSVGWNPTKVESGEAAIHKIKSKNQNNSAFNVMLVDWKMPGMDGLEVASTIRSTFKQDTAPIVLMVTAFSRDELLKQPDIAAIDGILNKPVTSSTLYNTVAEVLQRKGLTPIKALRPTNTAKGQRLLGIRILVVDDSEINREVAMRILKADGASVSLANDGKAALDWLSANPSAIDVVLMDVQMPVMDGYEATRHIRAQPQLANLPVIALTAGAFKTQQEAAQAAGMNAFVAKPFNVDELIATIQKLTSTVIEPGAQSALLAPAQGFAEKQAPAAQTAAPHSASLPGIEVDKGLHVWNDLTAYCKFLVKFSVDYADCTKRLSEYYATKNYAAAAALVHKLKGASGTMALMDVARCATELEAIDMNGDHSNALNKLQSALYTAFSSILLLTADKIPQSYSPTPISSAPVLTKEHIAEHLAELLVALDTDTPDRANQLLDTLMGAFPPNTLTPVRTCIDDFDFRGAETRVRQLARQSGIQLKE